MKQEALWTESIENKILLPALKCPFRIEQREKGIARMDIFQRFQNERQD
jgi:hypothetical protein